MKNTFFAFVAMLVIVTLLAFWYVRDRQEALSIGLEEHITAIEGQMKTLANTTGLAQVDDVSSQVVRDCTVRSRYEDLLVRLESLSATELREVEQLHARCADYYPTQRAFMVFRLENLFATYTELIDLAVATTNTDPAPFKQEAWRSLIAKEAARSVLLRQQYDIQGQIIEALVNNDQEALVVLLEEAQSIADSLNVTSIQINNERSALLDV